MTQNDRADIDRVFAQINALFSSNQYDQAEQLLQEVLVRQPESARALHALGAIACARGDLVRARDCISRSLQGDPENPAYHNSMGNVAKAQGDLAEARHWYSRALQCDPRAAIAHFNLGMLDLADGELEGAVSHLTQVSTLQPNHYHALFHLGQALFRLAEFDAAVEQHQKAIELEPSRYEAYVGAAESCRANNRSVAAERFCRAGLQATPGHPSLWMELGLDLLNQGRVSEAAECQRRALALAPTLLEAHSNLAFILNYDPEATQEEIHAASVAWEKARGLASTGSAVFVNVADPERPLRIGYVSADLRTHPVGFHLVPVLRNHDRSRFSIYCYYNSATGDAVTRDFMGLCDQWRGIAHLKDEEADRLIRSDQIDLLVDLSGHSGASRLGLFARKPAPVQATWLGYFNTTGLSAIDYLITDDATVLPGEEPLFSEKVLRLPWSRFCFTPLPMLPDPVPPPSLRNGCVTFGSFNNLAKVNPQVVSLWSKLLTLVPGSRLILKRGEFDDPEMRDRFLALFAEQGIEEQRLELRGHSPYRQMLEEYGDIDIALDTFPFSGGLTTLDALLMGVPVVTRSGKTPISRQTRAFHRALNLLELVARNDERYCAIACELARDSDRLLQLRGELRSRVLNSYLCDGQEFTRNLEHAYRTMWQNWCRK